MKIPLFITVQTANEEYVSVHKHGNYVTLQVGNKKAVFNSKQYFALLRALKDIQK